MKEADSNNGDLNEEPLLGSKKNNLPEDINTRSPEVQEIIGRPPHWLIRGGITAFLGVLTLIILTASVIKYPEVITAPIKLTAIDKPILLESKINGKLVKLHYSNNEIVEKGEILAWIESTASHQEVLELSTLADSMFKWLQENKFQRIHSVRLDQFAKLGELQTNFQSFEEAYREFNMFLPGEFYRQKRKMLELEMEYLGKLLNKLEEQKELQETNIKLVKQEYKAQLKLANKDLLDPIDLLKAESKVAASLLPLHQTESAIINNYASQTAKKKELLELNKKIAEQTSIFRQALNTLKSAIHQWKINYLLIAPVDGKLIYAGIVQENQTIKTGQPIIYIQSGNTTFFGEMFVSQRSFGKIHEGQKVLVRFRGFPEQEFGSVLGKIDYLSDFPVQDSVFLAKVSFNDGLVTNYDHKLPPTYGMRGQAKIIIEDMRLLERFYNNIIK